MPSWCKTIPGLHSCRRRCCRCRHSSTWIIKGHKLDSGMAGSLARWNPATTNPRPYTRQSFCEFDEWSCKFPRSWPTRRGLCRQKVSPAFGKRFNFTVFVARRHTPHFVYIFSVSCPSAWEAFNMKCQTMCAYLFYLFGAYAAAKSEHAFGKLNIFRKQFYTFFGSSVFFSGFLAFFIPFVGFSLWQRRAERVLYYLC